MPTNCNQGYLLIELMVAILFLTITGVILGHLKGQMVGWHKQAEQRLRVVIIADQIFQKRAYASTYKDDIQVFVQETRDSELPFKTVTAIIAVPGRYHSQEYRFQGGCIDLQKRYHAS